MKVVQRALKTGAFKQPKLRDFEDGEVIRLQRRLNVHSDITDPILLVDMQSYSLYCHNNNPALHPNSHLRVANSRGKRVIINLATGRLSCIDNNRECDVITAEIHTS